jgi:hypothetical protein
MTPNELEVLKKKETAIYTEEVSSTMETKLYALHAHLFIEHLLERYISTKLKTTEGLFGDHRLTFDKKTKLAQACGGVDPKCIKGIRKVNSFRNDFAHKFKYKPTDKGIHDFGRTLGKAYQEIIKSKHGRTTDLLLRAFCDRLCGAMTRTVVDAENPHVKPSG